MHFLSSPFGSYNKYKDQVASKQQKFLSPLPLGWEAQDEGTSVSLFQWCPSSWSQRAPALCLPGQKG